MMQQTTQQLDAIHAMLCAGQRNLRVEKHSLILWGLTTGTLLFFRDDLFNDAQFPARSTQAVAWLILLIIVISGISLLDWHLTRQVKQSRNESWSFIHRQVLKVTWLLMSIGTLYTFASAFLGGANLTVSVWLVLCGIALYVHGLFSEELLEWISVCIIGIGIGVLLMRLEYTHIKWVASATTGIGLPLLAFMLDHGRARSTWYRFTQTLTWLACVLTLPVLTILWKP
jgi:hypothetical protein